MGQVVDEFVTALKNLAGTCEFKEKYTMIRDSGFGNSRREKTTRTPYS